MLIRRRHIRVEIEQKTVRLSGVPSPGEQAAGNSFHDLYKVTEFRNTAALRTDSIRDRLHSLYAALRRALAGTSGRRQAHPGNAESAVLPPDGLIFSENPPEAPARLHLVSSQTEHQTTPPEQTMHQGVPKS